MKKLSTIFTSAVLLLSVTALFSCRTERTVYKEKTTVDSSVVTRLLDSVRLLQQTINYLQEREQSSTGIEIVFQDTGRNDTILYPRDVFRIDRTGKLEAEGRLKSVKISETRLREIVTGQISTIDSLRRQLVDSEAKSGKTSEIAFKEVVKYKIPWFLIFLLIALGVVAWFRKHIPYLKLIK